MPLTLLAAEMMQIRTANTATARTTLMATIVPVSITTFSSSNA